MPFGSFVGPDHLGGDVAGNGISKLFFTIIGAVAAAERDRIAQRILDGEAAAMAVEMIAAGKLTGLLEIDEKRQGGPHLRELQAAVRLKIDRRRREQERDPLLVEQHNWINFLDAAAKTEESMMATAATDRPGITTAGNAKRGSHHVPNASPTPSDERKPS